jgi:ribose transport system ATP-binding protein
MSRVKEENGLLLEVKDIVKDFPGVRALDKVSFDLNKGEVHVLVGENGAGKSTLGKIIVGAITPDGGKIYLNGKEVHILNPVQGKELGITMIFQEFNLVPYLSVAENIFLGREPTLRRRGLRLMDWGKMHKDARSLLEMLGSSINPKTTVHDLNVAEQQMVELAKALSMESQIIIMDEPTAALSSLEVDQLFEIIKQLRQQGIGIIYISHRLEEIARVGDRFTVLRDGEYIGTLPVKEMKIDSLIQMMVARQIKSQFPWEKREIGEEILSVENLTLKGAFQDVSFSLHRGEILSLAGLMGSGRSELVRAIFGAYPPDSGVIKIEGKEVKNKTPKDAVRRGIGLLPSDRKRDGLNLLFDVCKNTTIASLHRFVKRWWLQLEEEVVVAEEYRERLDIKCPSVKREVMYLSGGNQQKVALAKWLCSKAKIIMFDEPTRGVDVGVKVEVHQLMVDLAKQGVGIIMISSELPETLGMGDRILVMKQGEVVAEFTRGEATQEDILRYAA